MNTEFGQLVGKASTARRSSRRAGAAILAAAAFAAACGTSGQAGVSIEAVEADVVFGVAEPEIKEFVPALVAPIPETRRDTGGPLQLPREPVRSNPFSNAPPVPPLQPAPSQNPCPEAALGDAPEDIAAPNASAPPDEGVRRWSRDGFQVLPSPAEGIPASTIKISGFENRVVRNVEKTSDARWNYEVVQPGAGGDAQVTSYQVVTDATTVSRTPPLVGSSAVTVGEPIRGLVIQEIATFDNTGTQTSQFDPVNPILLLPLPVVVPSEINSTGIDSRSGESITITGVVGRREAVDACGTLIDGWLVEATMTTAGGGGTIEEEYNYVVSTDLGAILISEFKAQGPEDDRQVQVQYTVGDVEPSPVDDEAA